MRHTIVVNDTYLKSIYFSDEKSCVMDITPTKVETVNDLATTLLFYKPGFDTENFSVEESKSSVKIIGNIDDALTFLEQLKLFDKELVFKIRTDNKLKDFLSKSKGKASTEENKSQSRTSPVV